jgi:hypothetical protein
MIFILWSLAEGWSTYQVNNDSLDLFDIFEAPLWHQISKKNSSIMVVCFLLSPLLHGRALTRTKDHRFFWLSLNRLDRMNIWLSGSLVETSPYDLSQVRARVRGPARTCLCFGVHHQRMESLSLHTHII